jgi:hypothetical protein
MESMDKFRKQVIKTGRALCELPKISVVYATDKMFRSYVYGFGEVERQAVNNFFKLYKKYGLLSDELKTKRKIFKEVIADRKRREYVESLQNKPNRLIRVQKPKYLLPYSGKELGFILRKLSFQSYLDKRKPKKMTSDDFDYLVSKMGRAHLNDFNKLLNSDI